MRRTRPLLLAAAAPLLAAFATATSPNEARAQAPPPYRDARLPIDARIRDLIGRMSIDDEFWQLFMLPGDRDSAADYAHGAFGLQIAPGTHGADARGYAARVNAIQHYFVDSTRLGIPIIPFDEAVHGLVRPDATVFPAAIGLAATFDTALVSTVAGAIAVETRSRGIRQVLSPVVNIASDVRWGRVEETYGEDPVLASSMARAFVSAFETRGVVATPKHLVANVGEGGRDSYPMDVDRRELEERYFPPFRAAIVDAHARSVMSAYNSVDGSPATQNRALLTGVLRGEWGFRGFVISDAAATGGATILHDTEASTASATKDALDAGLDVIFQSSYPQHRPYLDAFRRGLVAQPAIDSAVAHVLRVKFDLGLFEHPYVDADSAAAVNGSAAHLELARQAERESIVLLRNERSTLPLSAATKSLAVIGVDAAETRLGGYSGPGVHPVSIVDGIRERLGASGTVRYEPGPGRAARSYATVPAEQLSSTANGEIERGLLGEYFDNNTLTGVPRVVRTDPRVDFGWTLNSPARGIPFDWYSVRWTGRLTVPAAGQPVRTLGVEGNDGYRLWLDDKLIVDDWHKQSYGAHLADVSLPPGSVHTIRLEYFESTGNARVKLVWSEGVDDDWRGAIDRAVEATLASDAAVVVAGVEEGEFRDRASLALPGHQEELIERVAATGKPVVVLLVGGSAITMSPWLERVGAVLDLWYPGEQGGRAVADVLFGDADPAGRLPITFPISEGQLPLYYDHKPTGRGDDYVDLTGQPLFPFGFGESYTTFRYSSLSITPAEIGADGTATVRFRVTNTGSRAGDEVPQLYIRDLLASVARPVMQLERFTRLHLAPGESRDVAFTLSRDQLEMFDGHDRWVVEPGSFRVMIGASSKDIRLRGALVVK